MTAASEVKLAYWANGTDANQKPKSSTGSGVAAAFGEAAVSNTIAPVKESIQVTGPKEITLTYDATIVASDINSTNGKSQYTVKIGNTVETIVSISILSSSKSVKFVTTNSMTAASEVKLAYWANGTDANQKPKSSTGSGVCGSFWRSGSVKYDSASKGVDSSNGTKRNNADVMTLL